MKVTEQNLKVQKIKRDFIQLNHSLLKSGISSSKLQELSLGKSVRFHTYTSWCLSSLIIILIGVVYQLNLVQNIIKYTLGVRCIIPNNYFIWEATRPISDCRYCEGVEFPITLYNVTREQFAHYAYSSKPIVVKKAFSDWPAFKYFNFTFFKNLYDQTEGAYKSVDDECQFLHFKSDFISLRDVFSMDTARINNEPGTKSWYVGW